MCWRSTTRGLSQIWLLVREKSKFFLKPCYVLATCKNLNMAISTFFFPWKCVEFGRYFHKKSFVEVAGHFLLWPSEEISTKKNAGYNLLYKYGEFKVFFLLMWRKWAIFPIKSLCTCRTRAFFWSLSEEISAKKRWIQPIVQIWRLQSIFPLNVAKVGHFAPPKKSLCTSSRNGLFFSVARLRNLAQKENPLTGSTGSSSTRTGRSGMRSHVLLGLGRQETTVDDRAAALLKTKGPRFEGFWVSGASSRDGGAHSARSYCSRRRARV